LAEWYYLGFQAGYADNHNNSDDSCWHNQQASSDGFAGRVLLGYQFHPNFSVEAGYNSFFFGTPDYVDHLHYGKLDNSNDYGYAADLVGKMNVNVVGDFGLYAKAGAVYLNDGRDGIFDGIYGLGAYYDITSHVTADLSWTRYNAQLFNSDHNSFNNFYALGVMYKFNLS
jgi:hypothetical protein